MPAGRRSFSRSSSEEDEELLDTRRRGSIRYSPCAYSWTEAGCNVLGVATAEDPEDKLGRALTWPEPLLEPELEEPDEESL